MTIETIRFTEDRLFIIDQTLLPNQRIEIELDSLEASVRAIQKLGVRGAPAIGITAAYTLYIIALSLQEQGSLNKDLFLEKALVLKNARPTAVNLAWAVDKMLNVYEKHENKPEKDLLNKLRSCAVDIHEQDKFTCKKIGLHGAGLLKSGANVLTHCNAGILATGGMGTALAPVYSAVEQGKDIHVYVDETRPLGQGTRLTFWELKENAVPATVITDNVAGSLMQDGKIDIIIVGADRVAGNGDFANKIGTYPLAVLAEYHKIPFYCAAPLSTFDNGLDSGSKIPIEVRKKEEITGIWNIKNEEEYRVYNPAFDVTPHQLVTGFITEFGIIEKPFNKKINSLFNSYKE